MDNASLHLLLAVWLLAAAAVMTGQLRRRIPGTGLVLAYVLNMWMIHWVAPALYLLPSYQNFDPQVVIAGLEQSTYGIVSFGCGLALAPLFLASGLIPRPTRRHELATNLPQAYVRLGIIAFVLSSTALGGLPTARAIITSGQRLIGVGLALCCWQAWQNRDFLRLRLYLFATLALPFATVVTLGYLGYGTVAALSVLIFLFGFVWRRPAVIVAFLLLAYFGLSVYVTYMRDRGQIRQAVWGGQPLQARVSQVTSTFADFELFDVSRREHLDVVDERLNQSFLTGLAVNRLSVGGVDYAGGATLRDAALALIPRALWPEKPIEAGSGDLVSEFTGLQFAADTSVGIGPVMEFYVNFGTLGVIIGFMMLGVLVTTLDIAASERLALNDLPGFALWYLPGLSLLQVGGSLVEVTATGAASLVVAVLANKYLDRPQRSRTWKHRAPHSKTVFPSST
jgi:hypothetical protein